MSGTPLSVSPYWSRFKRDILHDTDYYYVNMTFHAFYGGTSLQSQELNELQESIYNQLSLANEMMGNWVVFDGMTNKNINLFNDVSGIVPLNIEGITFET